VTIHSASPDRDRALRHVYGPVPSRRLGRSLGIDPVPPKTCNWNCVYCQLGRTTPLSNERRSLVPARTLLDEVKIALDGCRGAVDWITFLGSGEPTLHAELGHMIREVQAMAVAPVAVLTNGSLLHREDVRDELAAADAVLPSLDAGTEPLHQAINRPHPGLHLDRHVEGLAAFRRSFRGRLWVEVMLVAGLNDDEAALRDLSVALHRVEPDEVHLVVPSRPPAEEWVRPPGARSLERARRLLGANVRLVPAGGGDVELDCTVPLVDSVIEVITRHPMSEVELRDALARGRPPREVARVLRQLRADGRARVVKRRGRHYWSRATYRYGATLRPPAR
jgi:wyosine [tRNA(Phe)-imidazoG37] synthetase (radical SAM superfamily)